MLGATKTTSIVDDDDLKQGHDEREREREMGELSDIDSRH